MTTEFRLSKFISINYKVSRNEAEKLINDGKVEVNGKITRSATIFVSEKESVKLTGISKKKQPMGEIKMVALHKPKGFVVTRKDEHNRRTIYSILPSEFSNYIYIGRLDIQSEGLLLLTNSGDLAHEMESPKNEIEREYEVRVFGYVTPEKLERMRKGVSIDGLHYKAKSVTIKKKGSDTSTNTWLSVILTTGKNQEVRKLMKFFNLSVNRLVRARYANVNLGSLPLGAHMQIHRNKLTKVLDEVSKKCGKTF